MQDKVVNKKRKSVDDSSNKKLNHNLTSNNIDNNNVVLTENSSIQAITLETLPTETLIKIFNLLPSLKDKLSISRVSKRLNQISELCFNDDCKEIKYSNNRQHEFNIFSNYKIKLFFTRKNIEVECQALLQNAGLFRVADLDVLWNRRDWGENQFRWYGYNGQYHTSFIARHLLHFWKEGQENHENQEDQKDQEVLDEIRLCIATALLFANSKDPEGVKPILESYPTKNLLTIILGLLIEKIFNADYCKDIDYQLKTYNMIEYILKKITDPNFLIESHREFDFEFLPEDHILRNYMTCDDIVPYYWLRINESIYQNNPISEICLKTLALLCVYLKKQFGEELHDPWIELYESFTNIKNELDLIQQNESQKCSVKVEHFIEELRPLIQALYPDVGSPVSRSL